MYGSGVDEQGEDMRCMVVVWMSRGKMYGSGVDEQGEDMRCMVVVWMSRVKT